MKFKRNPSIQVCRSAHLFLCVLFPVSLVAQHIENRQEKEYAIKAAFMEKLIIQVDWPADTDFKDPSSPIIFKVIGENPFGPLLETFYSKRRILGKEMKISFISQIEEIGNAHVLFISPSEKRNVNEILEYTKNKPILTIGDSIGFLDKGVHINLIRIKDNVRFEINQKTANQAGLRINYRLLSLASCVISR